MYDKNKAPTITWKPWNPVITKNTDPYTESLIANIASLYSKAWRHIK